MHENYLNNARKYDKYGHYFMPFDAIIKYISQIPVIEHSDWKTGVHKT